MKTKIKLPRTRYFAEVFLWDNQKELQEKTDKRWKEKSYQGIYKPSAYVIYPRRKVKPKLGEIHLHKGRLGVGLLSHEVLHCIFDYAQKSTGKDILDISDNHPYLEKLCFLQGELVRRIANWLIKIKAW